MEEGYNPRDIKSRLALEITRMYHGSDEAKKAADQFEQVHQKKELPDEIEDMRGIAANQLLEGEVITLNAGLNEGVVSALVVPRR